MRGKTDGHDGSLGRVQPLRKNRNEESQPRVAAHRRPDSRPMRLAFGAGALVAVSVMSAGLIQVGLPSGTNAAITSAEAADPPIEVRHLIRYIHLKPGEVAPPGATVITPDAPAPKVVVTHVAAPMTQPRRMVVTRQSGRP
jgi:hypothetical protein